MDDNRQIIPIAGMLATAAVAAYIVVQLDAQAPTRDLTQAAAAEVRDAGGAIILKGAFVRTTDDHDTELVAALAPTGIDPDALGEAEVEFLTNSPVTQEVEFSVDGVAAGATFTFVIDGMNVATGQANRRGHVDLELKIPLQ
jgi:hypothetical protein